MPNQYTYAPRHVEQTCERCGCHFTVRLSEAAAGKGRFCSRPCQWASLRDQVDRTCETCGETFTARGSRARAGLARFCGNQCRGKETAERLAVPMLDRLWPKVDKNGPIQSYSPSLGPCWIWTGRSLDRKGYGHITDHKKLYQVHRVVYEALVGPIPAGFYLDHLCLVPRCCRPEHLEAVTPAENNRRRELAKYRSRL